MLFDPTQRLVVELEAQEWNVVLAGLAELQRSVAALMGKIARQAQAAQQPPSNGAEPAREAARSADG